MLGYPNDADIFIFVNNISDAPTLNFRWNRISIGALPLTPISSILISLLHLQDHKLFGNYYIEVDCHIIIYHYKPFVTQISN